MKCGLLPLSQDALFCGKISYHDYRGILIEDDVKKLLVEDLGPINKVMILRNHGFVACGETIEEAWKYAFNVINACEVQVRAAPLGIDQLHLPSSEQQKRVRSSLDTNQQVIFFFLFHYLDCRCSSRQCERGDWRQEVEDWRNRI